MTQMNWEEVRTRMGQEASKRFDLALYRLGLAGLLAPQPGPHSEFLFAKNKDSEEFLRRSALLQQHLPRETDKIIQDADGICRHEFHLLGYEKLAYGPNIDWHCDPVHAKRSPLKPWYKINFLDFHEVGDHKIIWELNRHQHLVTLAKARLLTGNRVYTDELVAQWYSWLKANPYPLGINWASTLEVAFRSLSWLWIRNLAAGCPDISADFQSDITVALQLHGRYIERYLSTYFSPNTHLLGEAVALFFIGMLCPEISAAKRWQERGWKIVQEESERQVHPDGVYFEQALYYHVYALDFFLHARHLAGENGLAIPEEFDNRMKKMLDVVHALSELGAPEGFGDDDGGRVFNPRRNQVEHMTDPLALGSVLYACNKYTAAGLTEEAIWLFGDKAIEAFSKPRSVAPPASRAFAAGGIYLINDTQSNDLRSNDQQHCPQQLMIDAGPQGTGHSGHGHADALSIRFSLNGHRFLVDSGTYCYISDGDERDRFRGTAAHNTLKVDNLDQAVPEGPFAWSSLPKVRVETWLNGQTFDFFAGSHDGYRRLSGPVLHRRFVFHVKGGLWFVRDVAEGHGSHLLEIFWHFSPDLELTEERGALFAEYSGADTSKQNACMALLLDRDSAWTTEIVKDSISRAYGSKQVAPTMCATANVTLPEDCGVLFQPTTRASDVGTLTTIGKKLVRGVRGYRYQTLTSTEFLFFAPGNTDWTCGSCTSDASLLYCKLEHSRFVHVIMVSGSFADWRGKRFVSNPGRTETFEWLSHPGLNHSGMRHSGLETDLSSEGDLVEPAVVSDVEFLDSEP
ncbi:MAG: alginate lyase family protein [Candidatus Sulfotelmatobacter sp.]